ncbi:hypothetical protein BDF20DRAFT_892384 [Mycotypha africana]|uniref:uncharacterized protein n=1 Tax=Mycotypha africana TaxID=64632 RepID=UPI0023005E8B|nr:uncharacterized protein BDF20DRAFT_892384 [Mycotypha africana]KAI8968939.1 hypothetical protein BDF20DRAFT_892384 [Mycotypha africana]
MNTLSFKSKKSSFHSHLLSSNQIILYLAVSILYMNSSYQLPNQLVTVIFILFFVYTFSPFSILFHISAICYFFFLVNNFNTEDCQSLSRISQNKKMITTSKKISIFRNLKPAKTNSVTPVTTAAPKRTFQMSDKFTQAQKEAALPFITPPTQKVKSATSKKAKALGRFFKKLASKESLSQSFLCDTTRSNTYYNPTFIPIDTKKWKKSASLPVITPKAMITKTTSAMSNYHRDINNVEVEDGIVTPETIAITATPVSAEKSTAATNGHISLATTLIENAFPEQYSNKNALLMSSSSSSPSPILDNNHAIATAQRIWDEDKTVYQKLDQIVEWIGDGKPESNAILKAYMNHFDFSSLKLEQAFRNLCFKLHLKGETQQIDRILSEFSTRYFECNPTCLFKKAGIIHAIVYSLLLLNTDLHVAQGDYKKMTRAAFVKNTMDAIYSQLDENTTTPALIDDNINDIPLSDDHRASGISFQSFDWMHHLHRTPSNHSAFSTRSNATTTHTTACIQPSETPFFSQNTTLALTVGSKAWQMEMKNLLKELYTNIRNSQISTPDSPATSIRSYRVDTILKRSVNSKLFNNNNNNNNNHNNNNDNDSMLGSTISTESSATSVMQYQSVAAHLSSDIPTSYTSNAPYYKEGMVVRKHLMEKANQKAKHRDWKECFMVIERSQLRMYKLENASLTTSRHHLRRPHHIILRNNANKSRSSIALTDTSSIMTGTTRSTALSSTMTYSSQNEPVVGGGDWMANAQLIGSLDLKHTLANALPSGYSRQRQYAFALEHANGAVHLFQVGSDEQLHEWVSTCNYWAARESKEPLPNGVSSMDYGWGNCLNTDNNNHIVINDWQAPEPPTNSSMLDEVNQLETLRKHVQELTQELDQHRDLKAKMEIRFGTSHHSSKSGVKALSNWEKKSRYLLREIIKYQNYCDAIEKSLELQKNINSAITPTSTTTSTTVTTSSTA